MDFILWTLDSKKGKECIVVNNFKLSEYRTVRNGTMYRCTNRSCKTYVIADASAKIIIRANGHPHNHKPLSDQDMAREIVKSNAIKVSLENMNMQPRDIVQRELDLNPNLSEILTFNDFFLIRKSIYTARSKMRSRSRSHSGSDFVSGKCLT